MTPNRESAIDLLHGLVAIPSLSRQEDRAVRWLVGQMQTLGYDRAFVDEAGNAVGEMGPVGAQRCVILLGHIDTVAGAIPVRIEPPGAEGGGPRLYGRGSVDAKGPLAAFVAAVAQLGSRQAAERELRLVVVGAVEEEAATSRGARFIQARFDGRQEPTPDACIIGEPSSWHRVTLGYKGRLLIDLEASQPMAHTAGPDSGVATVAVDLWNWITAWSARFNQGQEKAFDQILPSLRGLQTWTDGQMQERVEARVGLRLPVAFAVVPFLQALVEWAQARAQLPPEQPVAVPALATGADEAGRQAIQLPGSPAIRLHFHGYEPAWRSERSSALVRAYLAAIRAVGDTRPSFVVKTGTSDMNVVAPIWQCPILAYGPGDSSLDHTPHEHIDLDEYWLAVQVTAQALQNLAATPNLGPSDLG